MIPPHAGFPVTLQRCLPVFFGLLAPTELVGQAAIDRGSWIVGGSARFSHERFDDRNNDLTVIQFAPQVGYFVVRGLALTLNGRLTWTRSDPDSRYFQRGLGPGLAYYFKTKGGKVSPYLSGQYLRLRSTNETDAPVSITTQIVDESTWIAAAGVAFFAATHVAITGEAFYSWYAWNGDLPLEDGSHIYHQLRSQTYGLHFGFRIFLF